MMLNSTFYFSDLDDFLDANPDAEYVALGEYDYSEYLRKERILSSCYDIVRPRYYSLDVYTPIVKQSEEHPKWWFPKSNA